MPREEATPFHLGAMRSLHPGNLIQASPLSSGERGTDPFILGCLDKFYMDFSALLAKSLSEAKRTCMFEP